MAYRTLARIPLRISGTKETQGPSFRRVSLPTTRDNRKMIIFFRFSSPSTSALRCSSLWTHVGLLHLLWGCTARSPSTVGFRMYSIRNWGISIRYCCKARCVQWLPVEGAFLVAMDIMRVCWNLKELIVFPSVASLLSEYIGSCCSYCSKVASHGSTEIDLRLG